MHGAYLSAAVLLAASCSGNPDARRTSEPPPPDQSPTSTAPVRRVDKTTLAAVGLDPAAIDRATDPCDDFYQFACGGWLARTEIPADHSRYGRMAELTERNQADLKAILEDARTQAAAGSAADPVTARLGAFYGACMDEEAVEKNGTRAIDDLVRSARRVSDRRSLGAVVTALHERAIFPLFSVTSDADFKEATRTILYVEQGGLGLPDRDYYLAQTDAMKAVRTAYRAHLEAIFGLQGAGARARQAAADVIRIETALARASRTRAELQDPKVYYNKIDRGGLEKLMPRFPWGDYFRALGAPEARDVSVSSPDFLAAVDKLMAAEKPAAWRAYLEWHIVNATADTLSKRYVDLDFAMTKTLTGQAENRPRWKRCVAETDSALGELLAQAFVKARFNGTSKDAADRMVREIARAFSGVVKDLEWMTGQTKQRALEKLSAMAHLVGYPRKWREYDFALGKVYGANVLAARRFDIRRQFAKVGTTYDREEWHMTPPTVNAYYNAVANQMVFPAGILQPPFFAAGAHIAVNLGAIGMVVGHELTHGFDDSGSQFDADGNMTNWWQESDATEFKKRGECVVKQYGVYEPIAGLKVNGELTLNENIADLGGVKLAFRAYRAMAAEARRASVADGFTEDQLFFLAVGQAWCSKSRDEEQRRRLLVDTHSPSRFRVNGPLSNLPEFHAAFSCEQGRPMHPATTCAVW